MDRGSLFPYQWDDLQVFDWVQALKEVPQDPVYHAEGDVWVHTGMVMEALQSLPGFQGIIKGARAKAVLSLATAMHDMAKPMCTREEDGRIISPRHALKGRLLARQALYRGEPAGLTFAERELVGQLVRYHGLPLWILEKANPQLEVIKASLLCDLQWLSLLAEADVRGRICEDQTELLDRVELFREYCREQGVWEGPYPFKNGVHRAAYVMRPENGPLYVPYEDFSCTVTLMSGLPGMGKDHWVREHAGDLPVVSLDGIRRELGIAPTDNQGRVIQAGKEAARGYLRKQQDFVWNATNLSRDIRGPLLCLFREYRARVRIIYVEVPWEDWRRQNREREAKVPEKVLDRMLRRWEVPEVWEAEEVVYAVGD